MQRCEAAYGCICSFHRHQFLQNSSCFCIVLFDFQGCWDVSVTAFLPEFELVSKSQHLRMQSYRRAASTSWLHGCGSACGAVVHPVFSDFETAPASACFANVSRGILP